MQLNTCLTVPQLYRLVCWASDQPCRIPCSKQFRKQQKKIELVQTRHKHEEQLNAVSWNNHTSLKKKVSCTRRHTHKSLSNRHTDLRAPPTVLSMWPLRDPRHKKVLLSSTGWSST
jgi:isocitrate dehydrogenase